MAEGSGRYLKNGDLQQNLTEFTVNYQNNQSEMFFEDLPQFGFKNS